VTNEVYPRAPVQFVVFELQYPMTPALAKAEGKELVYDRLAEQFPLLETLASLQIQFNMNDVAASALPLHQVAPQEIRMTNRHRTTSVTVGSVITRIEQAAHVQFSDLRALVEEILEAVQSAARIYGLQRATLRYIDEIQYPDARTPADWASLVHPGLIGPIDLLNAPVVTDGVAVFQLDPQHMVRLVYGAQPAGGFAVDPNGPLRVRPRPSDPFFKLDIESTWVAPPDEVPELLVPAVLELADRLHDPISEVFEASLTPQLRDHFRTPA
jgi:uncharacterized protein (TIGR04255 family)